MSDVKSGGDSPTRPGTNVAEIGVSQAGKFASKHQDRPVRRRTKRPKGKNSAIRADNLQIDPPNGDAHTPAPCQSVSVHSKSEGVLGEAKSSKRRRRRRRNRKSKDGSTDITLSETTTLAESGGTKNYPQQNPNISGIGQAEDKKGSDQRNADASSHKRNRRNKRRRNSPHSNQRENHNPPNSRPGQEHSRQEQSVAGLRSTSEQRNAPRPSRNKPRNQVPKAGKARRNGELYAALDLGTNNCRLLVALPQQPGRFRVVDAFSKIVRLGEGLAATGALSDDAMDRAVGALKSCADKLTNKNIKGVRLIATEACRRATNGEDFLMRVEREAGLKLEIVDRETEARLAVAGCASLVDRQAKGVVLFDIGGGSSELALLDLRRRKKYDLSRAMVSWTSLPMGVVTLSENHGGGKHVTRQIFDGMVADVADHLSRYEGRDALSEAAEQGEIHLLGTSGTVTTLAGIHLKLPRYDRRQVDGTWMASKDVDAMIEALVEMDFEQRVANPCIGRDRADLVLAGCAILVAIQQLWPCPRLRVADRGLREGLLTEMMNADNAWVRRPKYFRHKRN